ncbi:unnamed protein product, partial [Symbiodinium sp. CCMP2456]
PLPDVRGPAAARRVLQQAGSAHLGQCRESHTVDAREAHYAVANGGCYPEACRRVETCQLQEGGRDRATGEREAA